MAGAPATPYTGVQMIAGVPGAATGTVMAASPPQLQQRPGTIIKEIGVGSAFELLKNLDYVWQESFYSIFLQYLMYPSYDFAIPERYAGHKNGACNAWNLLKDLSKYSSEFIILI